MDTKLKIQSESQEDINSLFYEDKESLQDGGSDRSNCSLITEGSNFVALRILPDRFAMHHADAIPSDRRVVQDHIDIAHQYIVCMKLLFRKCGLPITVAMAATGTNF